MSFEIKFADIKSINHNKDFWSKRDEEMKKESTLKITAQNDKINDKINIKINKLKCIRQSKKKSKIAKKIEKEYEIINTTN